MAYPASTGFQEALMPTQEEVARLAADFEAQYPEDLASRLRWWVRVVGIDRTRLFLLLGLTQIRAVRASLSDLDEVVAHQGSRAEMVDEILAQLLASFDYDVHALRTALRRPVGYGSGASRRL